MQLIALRKSSLLLFPLIPVTNGIGMMHMVLGWWAWYWDDEQTFLLLDFTQVHIIESEEVAI